MKRAVLCFLAFALITVCVWGQTTATTSNERTVEESYLQDSMEVMIIREYASAEGRDMKLLAIKDIEDAVNNGNTSEEILNVLESLSTEGVYSISRSGGSGVVTNSYPDVRREACQLMGNFKTEQSKNSLLRVVLADNEPMVIAAAINSLGKIGLNDNGDVVDTISYVFNKYDVLMPDNIMALETIHAIKALNESTGGLKDASAVRTILKIINGNYVKVVQEEARALLNHLRKSTTNNNSEGK